ncbi:DUF4097 family beta strand repeat protein [candidate division WOR-3 bacterium]|nr:DUF4097 family beta strand repeat protein [candidate division WOR-3 bacterium]
MLLYTEHFEKLFDLKEGSDFELENKNGGVRVEGWDKAQIKIEAEKKARTKGILKKIEIDITTTNNKVKVLTKYPKLRWGGAGVSYKIWLPQKSNIEIKTMNGGLRLFNLIGNLNSKIMNGGIEIKDCAGPTFMNTMNGGIEADFSTIKKGDTFEFKTTNGGIDLTIPEVENISIYAKTVNGKVQSDFPICAEESSLKGDIIIKAKTTNGGIRINKK